MKKLVQVVEEEGEGLIALMGKTVHVYCCRYIYRGKLTGVNDDCILLECSGIVYETGALQGPPKQFEKFASPQYIMKAAIESFGEAPGA